MSSSLNGSNGGSSEVDGGNNNGGNVKLLDRVRKLLGAGASASLSWEEFVSEFLGVAVASPDVIFQPVGGFIGFLTQRAQ